MSDRLDPYERLLLNIIENRVGRRLTGKDLREWSSSEEVVRKGLQDGEEIHHVETHGVWVAILSKSPPRKRRGGGK